MASKAKEVGDAAIAAPAAPPSGPSLQVVSGKAGIGIAGAMAAAFAEIEGATKSATNPHFKSKYADLGAVIDAIKPALINHGLFFTQRPEPSANGITVETVIGHVSGEEMSLGKLFVPANKNDAQAYGSALTYARRYALVTAFGVPVEDDDGNAAARGQSQGSAVSPSPSSEPAKEYPFPAGPAKNITELKSLVRPLWREVVGCSDESELDGLLCVPENKAIIQQLINLENPTHRRELWEGDGKDNPGLGGLIQKRQAEFKTDFMRA
jgi:hypothetical protein